MLSRADLQHIRFEDCNLEDTDLSFSLINESSITMLSFENSNLFQAQMIKVDGKKSNFINANISEANLSRADLDDVDFSNADLSRAILSRAVCGGAIFNETNLMYTDFSRTDLRGADLSLAKNLERSKMFNVTHDNLTKWPTGYVPPPSANER